MALRNGWRRRPSAGWVRDRSRLRCPCQPGRVHAAWREPAGYGDCEAGRLPDRRGVRVRPPVRRGRLVLLRAAGPGRTLAARWNGRAWLAEPAPSQGHNSRLDGVSCASAAWCVAVGAPAEAWTGTRWTIIPPPYGRRPAAARWNSRTRYAGPMPEPAPAPQNLSLTSVSCTSARFCMAVGGASGGASARPSPAFWDATLATPR